MTKVDLKNGIYGDYLFYKMQLLHDTVKDLYVVFTRYGRIGETGMSQRTPFSNMDEAWKEYCSIFKSKTGNELGEAI
ncbi:MAG: WGR domain-containing protein [Streptococcus sp.]|nr:WGR domain-containing protein [Streptococcus sp.]